MTRRADLDARIVRAAREAGAELLAPLAVKGLERSGDGLLVHTDGDALRCARVVAADGATGPTARLAGWGELPRRVPALESEVEVPAEALERFAGTARFDFDVPADGYAWVFPKRAHLSIGCVTTRASGRALRETLEAYLARVGVARPLRREDHAALIPIAPRAGVLARDAVLLVGDSAGLVDALTCEGLGHALESGVLAARAILEAGPEPGGAERRYQRSLNCNILPELRRARLLGRLVYGAPRLRDALFRRLGGRLARAMGELIAGERSYAELLGTPGNWLRGASGLLRGPAGDR
jgi:flavin-dependent dehydrogenase